MKARSFFSSSRAAFACFVFLGGISTTFAIVGDDCSNPIGIPSLPFSGVGNTCGFTHNIGGYCSEDNGAPDVVYVFVPGHHMQVNISLCGSAIYDTVLYVFKDFCWGTPIACNDDFPGCGLTSQIESLLLKANTTYYIVVDGFSVGCGDYTLSVTKVLPPGDGITTPYQLSTPQQLIAVGTDPDLMDKWFILANDINMQDYALTKAVIAPDTDNITDGYQGAPFIGVFDGDGYKITNLTITGGDNDYIGLFGFMDGGQVQNLGLEAVSITGADGSNGVGALAGDNRGNIINCHSTGTVEVGNSLHDVGGLVGLNFGNIRDCYSACTVTAGQTDTENIGGLVGYYNHDGSVSNCYASGAVTGTYVVGGLVGYNNDGSVSNCYASGDVTGTGQSTFVGGLVGGNYGPLSNCYSTGIVNGTDYVGGLVGFTTGDVSNCYAANSVSGELRVGGLAGCSIYGDISNCFATGSVNGNSSVGGLVGFHWDAGIISNCYAAGTVTGNSSVGGLVGENMNLVWNCYFLDAAGPDNGLGTPLTDTQMRQQSSFVGWDFVGEYVNGAQDFWQMPCGGGYPRLRFEMAVFSGKGTPEEPYQISTADQLTSIGADTDFLDKHFILTNDIDLSACAFTTAVIAPDTNPAGDGYVGMSFAGVFDGDGHTITNLTITGGDNDYIGLFGATAWDTVEGVVKNLGIVDCIVSGDIGVGGLMGWNQEGNIFNCYSTGTVSGTDLVGGLVGYNTHNVSNCYSMGVVNGTSEIGGLVGGNNSGHLSGCYSNSDVIGGHYAGGLAGFNNYIISNCYSTGSVSDTSCVGGLLGMSHQGSVLKNCYSTGSVSGTADIGGLVGFDPELDDIIDDCYFLISAGPDNYLGDPLSDAQMKQQSSFVDWDFTDTDGNPAVWMMLRRGEDYPRLVWQTIYPGDIAGLYGVNGVDFAELARNWLKTGCPALCEDADIDASGEVDLDDLILFAENWLMR